MKKFLGMFVFILFCEQPIGAEVEVGGFVDIFGQDQQRENSTFGMGAFEIDFAKEFSERVCFEGAVVVEGDEVGLGQTLVDFKLLNEKLGLQAGLLDMPFGIDYQVFATPDRKLVSPPLVTELIMDGGWGDVGVNLYGSLSFLNYSIYVVNGMGEDSGTPVNQLTDNNTFKTTGGRIGILPIKDLEFGFSYAQGPYLDDNTKEILSRIGGDIQFTYSLLQIKGEFVNGKEEIPSADSNEYSGYYLQAIGNVTDKLYGAARYGEWKPEGNNEVKRLTLGLGYDLEENVSLRLEYQMNEKPKVDNNLISSQIVISF